MIDIKKILTENIQKVVAEGYDDVSMDYIKNYLKKVNDYSNYDHKRIIGNYTYLNLKDPFSDGWLI